MRYENGVRAILKTDENLESNRDHIICSGGVSIELTCNYKIVLQN
jgi:hypothetical protein